MSLNEAEKEVNYNSLCTEVQGMWNIKFMKIQAML
jgi:hypothetical protein